MNTQFNIPSDDTFNRIVSYVVKAHVGRSYLPITKFYDDVTSPDKALQQFENEVSVRSDYEITVCGILDDPFSGQQTSPIITMK